jgi:thiamine kinase-like enzyme
LKVTTSDARYVVRISHPGPGLLEIDRDCEHYNSVAAAEAGVGAPVIEYRPELRILVVGFIEAHTCSKTDLQNLDQLGRAVDACRQLHDGPRFCNEFNMFELQANYLATVRQRGFRLPDRYLEFLPEAERIRSSLAATDEGTRPCHNDLLAENCLDNGRKAWLIDYEYSGNNDPCFELGNLWSESNLSLDHLEMMVARYYGSPSSQKVARARLQGLMSKYGWTLWASIQDATAPLDFDFWSWGMEKYERAVAELTSDQFDHLLDTAAGR